MPLLLLPRIDFEVLRLAARRAIGGLRPTRSRLSEPQRLCYALAGPGTTFIKIGRALNVRQELQRELYIKALQSLQDEIAPFPVRVALCEIERRRRSSAKSAVCAFR